MKNMFDSGHKQRCLEAQMVNCNMISTETHFLNPSTGNRIYLQTEAGKGSHCAWGSQTAGGLRREFLKLRENKCIYLQCYTAVPETTEWLWFEI